MSTFTAIDSITRATEQGYRIAMMAVVGVVV